MIRRNNPANFFNADPRSLSGWGVDKKELWLKAIETDKGLSLFFDCLVEGYCPSSFGFEDIKKCRVRSENKCFKCWSRIVK